jgi:hypothetical protein
MSSYLPPQPLKPNRRAMRRPLVEHHQRTGVAQPDVAVGMPLELDRPLTSSRAAHLVGGVAHHQPHCLPVSATALANARSAPAPER